MNEHKTEKASLNIRETSYLEMYFEIHCALLTGIKKQKEKTRQPQFFVNRVK